MKKSTEKIKQHNAYTVRITKRSIEEKPRRPAYTIWPDKYLMYNQLRYESGSLSTLHLPNMYNVHPNGSCFAYCKFGSFLDGILCVWHIQTFANYTADREIIDDHK